jgi:TonB family protein
MQEPARPRSDILPTLFGEGYGNYQVRPFNFLISFLGHTVLVALLLTSGYWVVQNRQQIQQTVTEVFAPNELGNATMTAATKPVSGGGGGGAADKLKASRGGVVKQSMEQFAAPMVIPRNDKPKLPMEASVLVPPSITLPHASQWGVPNGLTDVLSGGSGSGGGIGMGKGTGVGSGTGAGYLEGSGGGYGGGTYSPGGGVSAPRVLYDPEPEYSEEARKAKYQGVVVLWVAVDPDGRVRDIRVERSLGMGLDEKAVEAVRQWKFEPGKMNGHPVRVQVLVEVQFHLY